MELHEIIKDYIWLHKIKQDYRGYSGEHGISRDCKRLHKIKKESNWKT